MNNLLTILFLFSLLFLFISVMLNFHMYDRIKYYRQEMIFWKSQYDSLLSSMGDLKIKLDNGIKRIQSR